MPRSAAPTRSTRTGCSAAASACSTTSRKATSSSRRSTCRRSCPASASRTATWRSARRRRGGGLGARQHHRARPEHGRPAAAAVRIGVQRELPKGTSPRSPTSATRDATWAAEHQHPDVRAGARQPAAARRPAREHQLPAAVQGLLEHHAAPQRRVLGLQQRAVLPEQAPRRHQVFGQLHARQGHGPRQRQRRQPAGRRRLAADRQRRLLLFRRTDVVRSPPRAAHHPDLHAGVLRDRRDLAARCSAAGRSAARSAGSPASI